MILYSFTTIIHRSEVRTMIYKRFMVLSNTRNVDIYAYYCVFISPRRTAGFTLQYYAKDKWKSQQIIFLSKELWYIQEAAYCKVKILLLLNKKRATLLHINELIPEQETKNTVLNFKGHISLSVFFTEIRKSKSCACQSIVVIYELPKLCGKDHLVFYGSFHLPLNASH